MRSGTLADGHLVHYILNYSAAPAQITYASQGRDLLSGQAASQNGTIALPAWGVAVIEEGVASDTALGSFPLANYQLRVMGVFQEP